jgi:transposase
MAAPISTDLRKRIVLHYKEGGITYAETAKAFRVGEATVSRLLRRLRETGSIEPPARSTAPRFRVDLVWLAAHLQKFPDARLTDRVEAFEKEKKGSTSVSAVWQALRYLGITHKKNDLRQRARLRACPGTPQRFSRNTAQTCRKSTDFPRRIGDASGNTPSVWMGTFWGKVVWQSDSWSMEKCHHVGRDRSRRFSRIHEH